MLLQRVSVALHPVTFSAATSSQHSPSLSISTTWKCRFTHKTLFGSSVSHAAPVNIAYKPKSSVVSAISISGFDVNIPAISRPSSFARVEECLVLPANPERLRNGSPRAIISFFGGAFLGAAPEVTYRWLLESIARAGYLVVAVPYQLTFDHAESVKAVHSRLQTCLERLKGPPEFGMPDGTTGLDVDKLPLFGVGHSNGALLQVLQGSLCFEGRLPDGNIMISFNNKPASQAVPGFDQLAPSLSSLAPALRGSGFLEFSQTLVDEATKAVFQAPLPLPPGWSKDDLWPFLQMAEQVSPVLGQVAKGVSEFTPSPAENREACSRAYKVSKNLLVKFSTDSIDESRTLEELLRPRGLGVQMVELPGTHLTPLSQELKWEVGTVFAPWDAINQSIQTLALADMRRLIKAVVDWLNDQTR